jgi:hypothetical protein
MLLPLEVFPSHTPKLTADGAVMGVLHETEEEAKFVMGQPALQDKGNAARTSCYGAVGVVDIGLAGQRCSLLLCFFV